VLDSPRASRVLRARTRVSRPAITVARLRRANPAIVTISRSTFKLRLFRRLRYSRTFGIAVGRAGYTTPAGRYHVQNKIVNPPWTAPGWAGSLAGQTIPGGAPNNPLKARWLGLGGGYGIHGTGEPWSIGSRASHGCIRMRVGDVKRLYPLVPVGSLVLIA